MERMLLTLLEEMQVVPGTKISRERDGLISLLTRNYWREHNLQNPLLNASANKVTRLLMKGAAKGGTGNDASVDRTKLRSIRPGLRFPVLLGLTNHQATSAAFLPILSVVQDNKNASPIASLLECPLRWWQLLRV